MALFLFILLVVLVSFDIVISSKLYLIRKSNTKKVDVHLQSLKEEMLSYRLNVYQIEAIVHKILLSKRPHKKKPREKKGSAGRRRFKPTHFLTRPVFSDTKGFVFEDLVCRGNGFLPKESNLSKDRRYRRSQDCAASDSE